MEKKTEQRVRWSAHLSYCIFLEDNKLNLPQSLGWGINVCVVTQAELGWSSPSSGHIGIYEVGLHFDGTVCLSFWEFLNRYSGFTPEWLHKVFNLRLRLIWTASCLACFVGRKWVQPMLNGGLNAGRTSGAVAVAAVLSATAALARPGSLRLWAVRERQHLPLSSAF